jgi:hypothetical protein
MQGHVPSIEALFSLKVVIYAGQLTQSVFNGPLHVKQP